MKSEILIKNKIESTKTIKVSEFRKAIRKTEPHKHNSYFEIIYLSSGKGFHFIDYQKYEVKPPVIFFVRKEQVHHWELSHAPKGYVLILKKAFLDNSLDKELKVLLSKLSSFSCINLSDDGSVKVLFEVLTKECETNSKNSTTVIEGLLKALLAKIEEQSIPHSHKKILKTDVYTAFRELLSQDKEIKNSVALYASQLNTTPQNLNAVCRKAVNLSATEVLAEYMINEAKRLLIYTDNSVTEIATALNFTDVSHFIKYFKKHTTLTPQAFRTEQN